MGVEKKDTEAGYRFKQAGANAVAALAISPVFGIILQNIIVNKSENPQLSYSDISRKLFPGGKIFRAPAFNGTVPFCARQAVVAAAGVTATNKFSDDVLNDIPDSVRPVVSGSAIGTFEALVAGKFEQAELQRMLRIQNIKLSTVIKGSAGKNSVEWIACESAIRMCQKHGFSPATGFICGISAGAFAGAVSMPFQYAMINSIKNGKGIFANLIESGLRVPGLLPRAIMVAGYTASASVATGSVGRQL